MCIWKKWNKPSFSVNYPAGRCNRNPSDAMGLVYMYLILGAPLGLGYKSRLQFLTSLSQMLISRCTKFREGNRKQRHGTILSRVMRKSAFYIHVCENKGTDQRQYFRYIDCTHPKSEMSSYQSSVAILPGLCCRWPGRKTPKIGLLGTRLNQCPICRYAFKTILLGAMCKQYKTRRIYTVELSHVRENL